MKKYLYRILLPLLAIPLLFVLTSCQKDTPPKLSLNGTELDLSSLTVSDMNKAGFYLGNNDGSLPGETFKKLLAYYTSDEIEVAKGGISVLNRHGSKQAYTECEVFEITANLMDEDGTPTNLDATYNGQAFFGKTKDELIAMYGEPEKKSHSDKLVYYSESKQYKTEFNIDREVGCDYVWITRHEEHLVG